MASSNLIRIDIVKFLELAETLPVIDVRSPSEFNNGHIPGAFNIPLFDDREREVVGTTYSKEGRIKAILRGLEMSGPAMSGKLGDAIGRARDGKLLVHCWRGGMRSEAMAWLFSLGDIETRVLDGGYKAYRHHVMDSLSVKRKIIVLGGLTGSSKTHIIKNIESLGNQVIDLEEIACHKGSAFGALGQEPQPTTEQFSNLLFDQWRKTDSMLPVWLEDESRNIGSVFMPDLFFNIMQDAPTIILLLVREKRIPRLIEDYSVYPKEELVESVLRIRKRMGGDNAAEAVKAINSGDMAKAVDITLEYYDKTYMYSITRKPSSQKIFVESDTDDVEENARKVLEASRKITW